MIVAGHSIILEITINHCVALTILSIVSMCVHHLYVCVVVSSELFHREVAGSALRSNSDGGVGPERSGSG